MNNLPIIDEVKWKPIPTGIERRLLLVMQSWIGTPYMAGQQVKQIGVDCVQFVGGILDELFRNAKPTIIPRLPQNSGMHFARSGFRTAAAIRKQFSSFVVRDGRIEPGDVIVTRGVQDASADRRMGHTLLAGVRPGTLIHSINGAGVCWTSVEGVPGILRIYRCINKELWV